MITDIEPIVKIISELAGVVSVVVGVVMSIKSFNAAREKEAAAREKRRKLDMLKPSNRFVNFAKSATWKSCIWRLFCPAREQTCIRKMRL